MAGAGLISVGPIAVRIRKPSYNWTGTPDDHGIAPFKASGVMQWLQAQSVFELANNPSARVTKAGHKGVLEYLVFDDDLLAQYTGYYLLQSFDHQADWQWSGHGINYPVGFSLSAAFLGDVA